MILAAATTASALTIAPATAGGHRVLHHRSSTTHILVMGDSYSSGVGAGNYVTTGPSCARSTSNYGEQFAAALRAKPYRQKATVTTVACSGAVTQNFFTSQKSGVPAQLDAVTSDDDLIFATTGGNDAGFSSLIGACLINMPALGVTPDATKCNAALTAAETAVGTGSTTSSPIGTIGLKAMLAVHDKAPAAKIVLVGYPLLEGDTSYTVTTGSTTVAAGQRLHDLQVHADQLQQLIVKTANAQVPGSPFTFVSTEKTFSGPPFHGLYAAKTNPDRWLVAPFIDSTTPSEFYHPNPTGWTQITDLLLADRDIPKSPQATITSTTLPTAVARREYWAPLRLADRRRGTWSISAGSLPAGLRLTGCLIHGRPTTAGTTSFTVMFTDRYGRTSTADVTMKVRG